MPGYQSKKLMAESREGDRPMPRYSLVRDKDGAGDSGPMCQILDAESGMPVHNADYPMVGFGVRVGSPYGRTYAAQDYWQTTPITEITEESVNDDGYWTVKFKTKNSSYIWKEF
jgi:hypothetical protein